jgi:hypothetical protein
VQGPVPEGLGELGLRVALSVGELDKEAYQALYDAGRCGMSAVCTIPKALRCRKVGLS